MPGTVYSVGHSNVDGETFFAMLARHGIAALADVRAFPGSRRHPHFGRQALADACVARGIEYRWMPDLGGRRRPSTTPSPHVGWQVEAFRAYADYMDSDAFASALGELERFAGAQPTAFLCAEARWWQCHRRLIADRLVVAGWRVEHISGAARVMVHRLPNFARVEGQRIIYDAVGARLVGRGSA